MTMNIKIVFHIFGKKRPIKPATNIFKLAHSNVGDNLKMLVAESQCC